MAELGGRGFPATPHFLSRLLLKLSSLDPVSPSLSVPTHRAPLFLNLSLHPYFQRRIPLTTTGAVELGVQGVQLHAQYLASYGLEMA